MLAGNAQMSMAHSAGRVLRQIAGLPLPQPRTIVLQGERLPLQSHTVIGHRFGRTTIYHACGRADAERERQLLKAQGWRRIKITPDV